jgi:hypothetical protein
MIINTTLMKKITLVLVLFLAFSIKMNAQFVSGFETSLTDGGFQVYQNSCAYWQHTNTGSHSGNGVVKINYNCSNYTYPVETLNSPIINVTANVNDRLSFWVRRSNNNSSTTFLYVRKFSLNNQNQELIRDVILTNIWTKITVDLRSYIGQTIIIGFNTNQNNSDQNTFLDDVVNDGFPLCTPQTLPFSENFDTGNFIPNCWSTIYAGCYCQFSVNNDFINQEISPDNTGQTSLLVSPKIHINTGVIDKVSFSYKKENDQMDVYVKVKISTASGTNVSDFNTVIFTDYNVTTYLKEATIDLTAYNGQSVYLSFESDTTLESSPSLNYFYIDFINFNSCNNSSQPSFYLSESFCMSQQPTPIVVFTNLPSTGAWSLYQVGFPNAIATGTGSSNVVNNVNAASIYKFFVEQNGCISPTTQPFQQPFHDIGYPVMTGFYEDTNGNGVLNVGDKINYTITVSNTSICPLKNIKINSSGNNPIVPTNPNLNFNGNTYVQIPSISGYSNFITNCYYLITQNDITNGFVYNQSTLDFSWIEYNGFTQGTSYPNCTTQLANLSTDNFIFTSLKYYPNPVKNSLSISNQSIINEVAVTSILGQKIMSQTVNDLQTELDFSGLTNGVYFIKVLSEGQSKTIRIVKE